jgi:hypothetical protein
MSQFDLDDVLTLEGGAESEMEAALAMQRAINSGMAWKLQGSYGRAAMDALESGCNMLGSSGCYDYYGNYVPSRTQVEDGTKGSRGLVVERFGEDYAAALEAA